jgi:Zn-dependent peptidase ImmA (M78 family)
MLHIPHEFMKRGFNERSFTWEDFEEICRELGIKIVFSEFIEEGMYLIRRGYKVIALNSRLHGFLLLWVAFHELAHVLLHHPAMQHFARGTEDKIDAEANAIASAAIIPESSLRKIANNDFFEEFLYPPALLRVRLYSLGTFHF